MSAVVSLAAVFFTLDDLVRVLTSISDAPTALNALRVVLSTAAMALVCWFPRTGAALSWVALAVSLGTGTLGIVQVVMVVVVLVVTATADSAFAAANVAVLFLGVVLSAFRWSSPGVAVFWLGASLLAIGVVLGFIVRWVLQSRIEQRHQREVLAQVRRQAENARREERERVAHDMHDYVAHELTVIVATLAANRAERERATAAGAPSDTLRTQEILDGVERSSRKALDELRRVPRVLDDDPSDVSLSAPSALSAAPEGLSRRLTCPTPQRLPVETMVREAALDLGAIRDRVDILIDPDRGTRILPEDQAALAGRFLTEAVTNVVKHGGVGAHVALEAGAPSGSDGLRLRVTNSIAASGTASARDSTGMGIPGLRREAETLGATLTAGAIDEDDLRWSVELILPSKPPDDGSPPPGDVMSRDSGHNE